MLTFILLALFTQFVTIQCDCDYGHYFVGFDLTLQPIRNDYIISTKRGNYILPEKERITLYCEGNFLPAQSYYDSNRRPFYGQMITLDCDGNELYYSTDIFRKERFHNSPQFKCLSPSMSVYATKLEYCDYEGLLYGMKIDNTPIVLAEFCYNYNNSEIVFIHYVAAKRNALLKGQLEYNPSQTNISALELDSKVATISQNNQMIIELGSNFTLFVPSTRHLVNHIAYNFDDLVSSSTLSGHFKTRLGNIESFNSIPWWWPLKSNNWKIFENILTREASKRSFEIYAGYSHKANYPSGITCNSEDEVTFEEDGEDRSVPLYIWNYIIPRTHDYDDEMKEFVLIGINSPFVEASDNNSMVICEDICGQIDWLQPLEVTRRIPTFGYIFCCKPEDVQGVLRGLPQRNFV